MRVRKEGVDVYNLKQYMKLGGPVMTIVDVNAGRQTLKFSLKNYAMLKTGSTFLLIEALDKITGEKDVYSRLIEL